MNDIIKAACVQMNSGPDIQENLKQAETLIREAAGQGATFISTPENTCHILSPQSRKLESAPFETLHPAVKFFAGLADELSITLNIGSLSIKMSERKIANRSYIFGPDGDKVAVYDKIHLFDVDLPDGESHRESKIVQPGTEAVFATLDIAKVGLTICYDLRFPHQYRGLGQKGAQIILAPSAFTVPTGEAHWETLIRARSIENGCFMLAAAQCGEHDGGRKTYGHSLITAPWGDVLAEGSADKPGVIVADLDLSLVEKARTAIPSLEHDRDFHVVQETM